VGVGTGVGVVVVPVVVGVVGEEEEVDVGVVVLGDEGTGVATAVAETGLGFGVEVLDGVVGVTSAGQDCSVEPCGVNAAGVVGAFGVVEGIAAGTEGVTTTGVGAELIVGVYAPPLTLVWTLIGTLIVGDRVCP
jgi:hypothetical protein